MTRLPAGTVAPDGTWPADSANGRIAARLAEMAEIAREAGAGPDTEGRAVP